MNPIQMIIQMMQSGANPQQMLIQMLESQPNLNPVMQNLLMKAKQNDLNGATSITRNAANEHGMNFDKTANDLKNKFHL